MNSDIRSDEARRQINIYFLILDKHKRSLWHSGAII